MECLTRPSGPLRNLAFILLTAVVSGTTVFACNIPVFRYALERWAPDTTEIVVFYEGELTPEVEQAVSVLRDHQEATGNQSANVRIRRHQTGSDSDEELSALWQRLSKPKDLPTPYLVVRSQAGKGRLVSNWQGPLSGFRSNSTLQSPVRAQIGEQLLNGTSIIWLFLKSGNTRKDEKLLERLQVDLKRLEESVPIPDGIGLPGSELLSEVPLLMKFRILEISPDDAQETYLISLLQGMAPESIKDAEPLVVPVFGRGRALEVIPGSRLTTELTRDLTLFLCAACSCQVKEMNPGFDLLVATDWTTELYGRNGQDPDSSGFSNQQSDGIPILIEIPSGRPDSTKDKR